MPSAPEGGSDPAAAVMIRAAADGDAGGLIALIGGCFAEYPGCVLDVDGESPELRAIATAFAARSGRFWVAEREGAVIGSVGVVPAAAAGRVELCKLYVDRGARRFGLGARLAGLVEAEAARRGADSIELWTDTRFADAHRLYRRLGYLRQPGTRTLHDLSHTVEFHYLKWLAAAADGSGR